MTAVGNPIEAVLTLNATSFHTGLADSTKAVDNFKKSIMAFNGDASEFKIRLQGVLDVIGSLTPKITALEKELGNLSNLNTLTLSLKRLSDFIVVLSDESINLERGMTAVNNVFKLWGDTVQATTPKVNQITQVIRGMTESSNQDRSAINEMKQSLLNMGQAVQPLRRIQEQTAMMRKEFELAQKDIMGMANGGVQKFHQIEAISDSIKANVLMMREEFEVARQDLLNFANGGVQAFNEIKTNVFAMENEFNRARAELLKFAESGVTAFNEVGTASAQETVQVEKNTQEHYRNANAMSQSSARANQLSSATSRLGKALSSLRMIGTMVGSMLAYNFAHKLLVATGETVHAKSEMEGYFKMLRFSQSDIDGFNQALDRTVQQFQRVNKYSLGETISSIGVEFNLSTKEMEKAMKVTSMITSEYLRAGRNANEASLAVKDVLQGQFQRLSRETGVKGEQLKEAGWSGDTTDVLG